MAATEGWRRVSQTVRGMGALVGLAVAIRVGVLLYDGSDESRLWWLLILLCAAAGFAVYYAGRVLAWIIDGFAQ